MARSGVLHVTLMLILCATLLPKSHAFAPNLPVASQAGFLSGRAVACGPTSRGGAAALALPGLRPGDRQGGGFGGLGGVLMKVEEQTAVQPLSSKSTALVIGASRGIGLEMVKQLLARGCHVVATYRRAPTEELQAIKSDRLLLIECDVGSEESVLKAAESLKGKVRTGITHIVHNAGIIQKEDDPDLDWHQVRQAEILDLFRINAIGPILIIQAFQPLLQQVKDNVFPVFAIISSKVGSVEDNGSGGMYAYRASKAACNMMARSLSIDLADIARVVLLHPGYVRTDMTDYMGFIDPPESVEGMLRAIEATCSKTPFRWVDYKAEIVPW